MGKQKKPFIRFLYLLIGIHILAFTLFSCSVEESITKNKISERDIKIKNLTYSEFNKKTQNVKNKPNLEGLISENAYARTAEDSSKYEIYTDKIIEASKDDYTSYTMFLKAPTSTEKVYYNIVFKVKGEITEVFILKYTKTESGIVEEVITTFKSREGILGGGKNVLQVIDQFDGSGGGGDIGGSIGTPTSTNPGGMSWTGLGGSPIYPQNCNGTVTTTYVLEPHMCSENKHWPPSQCNAAQWAYYELVPYYSCVPNPSSGTTNPPTSGGGNTGGGTTTPPEDEEDITVMIQPIDCNEHIPGDLNGDCQLSPYETCLLSGNSQEVCDCVAAGGNIADCQDEVDCNSFEERVNEVLNTEGGFVNDPADPGGPTNKGISWVVWVENANNVLGLEPTIENLQNLTSEQAKLIYRDKYWDKVRCDEINDGDLRYLLFDFNVTSGGNAVKILKKTLNALGYNLTVNGTMDDATLTAINEYEDIKTLYNNYKIRRQEYYNTLVQKSVQNYLEKKPNATQQQINRKTLKRFINGWTNRVNSFLNKTDEQLIDVNC